MVPSKPASAAWVAAFASRTGARAATVCGLDFFGADHVVFASDCPFDKEKGPGYIRDTIKVLNSIPLSNTEREKICFRNAEKLFGLPASA